RAARDWGATGSLGVGVRRGGCRGGGRRATHPRGVVLVIGLDRLLDDGLVLTVLVLLPIDFAEELDAVEIREAGNAPRVLGLGTGIARMDAARGVEDRLDEGAAHVRPLGALGAVEADQRPHLAAGVLALHHDELAAEVHRAGVLVAGRVAAGPPLARIVEAARADGHAHAYQRAFRDQVERGLLVGVVEIEVSHGVAPYCCADSEGAGRAKSRRSRAGRAGPAILAINRPRCGSSIWSRRPERSLAG